MAIYYLLANMSYEYSIEWELNDLFNLEIVEVLFYILA